MKKLLILLLVTMVLTDEDEKPAPATQQMVNFKKETKVPIGVMTTSAGAPIEYTDASLTLNRNLIYNEYLMDSLTHLVRERIPERYVHAKGAGAFGYFEVTHDITDICKAAMFSSVGKKTPVGARFSTVILERGGSDVARDPRGFSIKFYTEEGNFDMVGFSTPMFAIKDPILFTTFVRAQKRNPATNLFDGNSFWDFLTSRPESLHMFMLIFGDRGIPDGFRFMPGFSIHTYQLVNQHGDSYFVRFHFTPDQGLKTLGASKARKISGEDGDYSTRDLYNAIGSGNYPSWTLSFQVLTPEDVKHAGFDVFDVTMTLPLDKYPLRPVGKLVLNKNPINYFAEVEQMAMNPSNLVPGILGAPDKLFEARRLAYRDTQHYRLGVNHNNIPVNCPIQSRVQAYNRDGRAPVKDNYRDVPTYYPNTFNGPVPYKDPKRAEVINIVQTDEVTNFGQARDVYTDEMSKEERSRLVENILYSLAGAIPELQDKAVKLYTLIHPDLGNRILQGLQVNRTKYHYEDDTYTY